MIPAGEILLTGGAGLLGSELRRLAPELVAPPRADLDLERPESILATIDRVRPKMILHAAAVTKIGAVEKDPSRAVAVNIAGTAHLAAEAVRRGLRFVYLSTDYVYDGSRGPHLEDESLQPGNIYAWTKLGGEAAVRLVPDHLVIRCSFGPRPYEYPRAAADKITSRLYVDQIAPHILRLARGRAQGVVNVGAPGRSMLEYARETRPDVEATTLRELGGLIPADTSLDLTRWRSLELHSG